MYDIDPAPSNLRLGINLQTVKARHEERADIRKQIESLLVRHCELTMLIDAEHAQSQPIRISASKMIGPEGVSGGRGLEGLPSGVCFSADNDFWTHRHRTMSGPEPKVARADGTVDTL